MSDPADLLRRAADRARAIATTGTVGAIATMLDCAANTPERDLDGLGWPACGNCGVAHLTDIARALLNHPKEN